MKQQMAKDSPRWPNIALKNMIFNGFGKPSWHQKVIKIGVKLTNNKISKIKVLAETSIKNSRFEGSKNHKNLKKNQLKNQAKNDHYFG